MISIDWLNKVIHIPKADLTLVQENPVEVRELDLNWLHRQLRDLEDSDDGMVNPDTHKHYQEVLLGGITYARIIEVINNYSVTFEDGQYVVNLTGANSNVGDVINPNQVSVRSNNSAGLISSPDIEYASFDGGVTLDVHSPHFGTLYPIGTSRAPVNNIKDAQLIAKYRGFKRLYILSDLILGADDVFTDFEFVGNNFTDTHIHIEDSAVVTNCRFEHATISGVLDDSCIVKSGIIDGLNYVDGFIFTCLLKSQSPIVLNGHQSAYFLNCFSDNQASGFPSIDCGGSGKALSMRNYNGALKIYNKIGNDVISLDLNSGTIVLDLPTMTGGTVIARGIGTLMDNNGNVLDSGDYNGLNVINQLINVPKIVTGVWNYNGEVSF
jgi:hypothetical protein